MQEARRRANARPAYRALDVCGLALACSALLATNARANGPVSAPTGAASALAPSIPQYSRRDLVFEPTDGDAELQVREWSGWSTLCRAGLRSRRAVTCSV